MPNAAATVLPWKRLPSVSAQITRSRISRSPAPKADSSIGPACTATARPSPVRVTVSGHGCGMPGSCWLAMRASILRSRSQSAYFPTSSGWRFPGSQGVPARPFRPPADRPGAREVASGGPRLRVRRIAGISTSAAWRLTPGRAQDLISACRRSGSGNNADWQLSRRRVYSHNAVINSRAVSAVVWPSALAIAQPMNWLLTGMPGRGFILADVH